MERCLLPLLLACMSLHPATADDPSADDIPLPAANRPDDFNGAIGAFSQVNVRAKPTVLEAEDRIQFVMQVLSDGPVATPPRRPVLEKQAGFSELFQIEPAGESHPQERSWEFTYTLRPRNPSVREIPALRFSYFRPGVGYQVRYTNAIDLHVSPRSRVRANEVENRREAPPLSDPVYQLKTGPGVLQRSEPWSPPGPLLVLVLFLVPLIACLAWALAWQRAYPDAARRSRQRRSRAAEQALRALRKAERDLTAKPAEEVVRIVTAYLLRRG